MSFVGFMEEEGESQWGEERERRGFSKFSSGTRANLACVHDIKTDLNISGKGRSREAEGGVETSSESFS